MTVSLILSLCVLPVCSTEAGAPAIDVRVHEEHGFRIDVPEGWREIAQDGGAEGWILRLVPPGSDGRVGVTVTVLEVGAGAEVEDLLERGRTRIAAGGAAYSSFEEWEGVLGERTLRGIRVDFTDATGEYHIDQRFLIEQGRAYLLQRHAPREAFDARISELEGVLETFALVELSEEARQEGRRRALVARCGSEVTWARDWAEAESRARREQRPVLVVVHLLSSFALGQTPRTTLLMDEDVIELVEERFVPLWYEKGMPAPFVQSYGLGPLAFGEALLVVLPDGEVIVENRNASSPEVGYAFLRAALERLSRVEGTGATPVPPGLEPLERARHHIARGELDEALMALEGQGSGSALRLRARALRLLRRGPEALAALTAAREAGGEPEGWLCLEEAELWASEREEERAIALVDRALADRGGDRSQRPPALVLRGTLHLAAGEPDQARTCWREVVERHSETRWAWQAAALLDGVFLRTGVRVDTGWSAPDVLAERLVLPDPVPEGAGNDPAAARAWLLGAQRGDGSWATPMETALRDVGPDPFVDAVTALGASALLKHGAREAAGRALAYLLASIARREQEPPRVFFMDYNPWSGASMLAFLADALEADLGEEAQLRRAAAALLVDLASRQQANGGWSYYVTSDLEGSAAPAQSISFTTAAVVLALCRAREAGFELPERLLEGGVAALLAMRKDGVFSYFLYRDGSRGSTDPPGAAGRGPLCELALLRAGASDEEHLRAALDRFLEHASLYAAEQGKVVMHAGPHGQGCHYLLFDYAHAALAQAVIAPHPETRARVLELVRQCRRAEGAYLDTPILGRAYGTAMALIALDALDAE
jgi:hypothetical protein